MASVARLSFLCLSGTAQAAMSNHPPATAKGQAPTTPKADRLKDGVRCVMLLMQIRPPIDFWMMHTEVSRRPGSRLQLVSWVILQCLLGNISASRPRQVRGCPRRQCWKTPSPAPPWLPFSQSRNTLGAWHSLTLHHRHWHLVQLLHELSLCSVQPRHPLRCLFRFILQSVTFLCLHLRVTRSLCYLASAGQQDHQPPNPFSLFLHRAHGCDHSHQRHDQPRSQRISLRR